MRRVWVLFGFGRIDRDVGALLAAILFCCLATGLQAQEEHVIIHKISIAGNKKTKDKIILRELAFGPGDTLAVAELSDVLEQSEYMVMNTGLFTSVTITFKNWEGATGRVHLHIEVMEGWYIFPVPIFELADRNFNVWWVEQNRSLDRVNFGMEFSHTNFTGRMDRLKLEAQYGYTRKYSFGYSLPYINRSNTLGISTNVSFSRNREINYKTVDNRQEFFQDESGFQYERFKAETALTYRPGLRVFHNLIFRYHQNRISEEVAQDFNPDFFLDGRELQRFFSMIYIFTLDSRDIRPYPINGNYLRFILEKDGLGFFPDRNALTFRAQFDHYFPLSDRFSVGLNTGMKVSLIRRQQPFNDNRAIGFGPSYLHGYEYYVIDGLDMGYLKSNLRWELFNGQINFGKLMPLPAFRTMPLKLYFSVNNDFGYANDPFLKEVNFLNNRLLWGGGFGLDIVLYYDKVIQVEYSFNQLFENGLFLHLNMNI